MKVSILNFFVDEKNQVVTDVGRLPFREKIFRHRRRRRCAIFFHSNVRRHRVFGNATVAGSAVYTWRGPPTH